MASPKAARHLRVAAGRTPSTDSGGRKIEDALPLVRVAPVAPDDLSDEARAEWDRVVPQLDRLHILSTVSRASLVAYCETWALYRLALEGRKMGLVVENRSVKKDGTESVWFTANPSIGIELKAQAALKVWCNEFGLTPAAESKVKAGPEVSDDEGDFD